MIDKSAHTVSEKKYVLRLTPQDLIDGYSSLRLFHIRKKGNAFVNAEGCDYKRETPIIADRIHYAGSTLYAYSMSAFQMVNTIDNIIYSSIDHIPTVVSVYDEQRVNRKYCVSIEKTVRLDGQDVVNVASIGGLNAVVYGERIFAAFNLKVSYSAPVSYDDWSIARGKAGYFYLDSQGGAVHKLVPYKGKLYLFRTTGISQLRVLGDELNFKVANMPYNCGKMVDGSIACCGERVFFMTDAGLFAFNGVSCEPVKNALTEQFYLRSYVNSASWQGRYYLLVKHKMYGDVLYCYDSVEEQGYFLHVDADDIASYRDTCSILYGKRIYALNSETDYGSDPTGIISFSDVEATMTGSKLIRKVKIEGTGVYRIYLTSGSTTRELDGEAGKVITLTSPLKTEGFSVVIYSEKSDNRFDAIDFLISEDEDVY